MGGADASAVAQSVPPRRQRKTRIRIIAGTSGMKVLPRVGLVFDDLGAENGVEARIDEWQFEQIAAYEPSLTLLPHSFQEGGSNLERSKDCTALCQDPAEMAGPGAGVQHALAAHLTEELPKYEAKAFLQFIAIHPLVPLLGKRLIEESLVGTFSARPRGELRYMAAAGLRRSRRTSPTSFSASAANSLRLGVSM